MKNQLLLLEDLTNVGRKGDLVRVKPGFARNFLIPQKKALIADRSVIKIQARLKEERAKQSIEDKKDAENIRARLENLVVEHQVKCDPEGHMYGSVAAKQIVDLLAQEGVAIEKKMVSLEMSIKKIGVHTVPLKLKEGVLAQFSLKVEPDSDSAVAVKAANARKAQPIVEDPLEEEIEANLEEESEQAE